MISRLWWLFIIQVPILALPTDDLTTEYAKRIIPSAKMGAMKGLMNRKVAPCDNFFEYACGNWHRHNPAEVLPKTRWTDTFKPLSDVFNRRLLHLLGSKSSELTSELELKMQRFFLSCTTANQDDLLYKSALKNVYREFSEMPAVAGAQWDSSAFNWWRTEARIHRKYGKGLILGVNIIDDASDPSKNTIYLGRPGPALTKSPEFNNFMEAKTSKDLENYLGVGAKEARNLAKNLHSFENRLFEEVSPHLIDNSVSLFTMAELEEKYISYLNFTEYIGLIFGEENIPEKIYVYGDEFLDKTLPLMKSTPSDTQANYILWNLLEPYLVEGNDKDHSKWCVDQTTRYFGQLTEHVVYNRYRSPKAEADVFSVWEEIRGVFRENLRGDKLDWISNATRQVAIEKLDRMTLKINSYDTENFEKLFGPVEIDRHNYVANIQHLLSAKAIGTVEKFRLARNSIDVTNIPSVMPVYNVQENRITIPVVLLQPHFFWGDEYPEALKYATLGFLLAHEMVHGFEGAGRSYDASGHSPAVDWWDNKSRNEFKDRKRCLRAQYHAYKYGGYELPEKEDQSENIADNAGVKFAYIAYEKWLSLQTEERKQRETMKGLDLSSRQIFFLGYGQLWCDDVHPNLKSTVVKFYNHAPSMYRVIGPLSNFQEFSRVFSCPRDSPMNRKHKCGVY
ncbi:neprilysin-1-like [Drosophila bipectinata]|uniref:neprilysin-1-like n=1 Tax=Drosophila bipectinata TaxID=42026 RepID=UPI0038B3DEEF